MTLNVVFDVSPRLLSFLERFTVPAFDELVTKIDSIASTLEDFRTEVSEAISAEGAQVSAAIAALESQLGNVLTPDEFAALADKLESLKRVATLAGVKAAVEAIYEPAPGPSPE